MARAITTSRYSKTADRPGPATKSSFHSHHPLRRVIAAEAMVVKRRAEIRALVKALARTADLREQQRLTARLLASHNNLDAWLAYLAQGAPREPRAVIIPPVVHPA